jgi:hypothetical protein
MIEEGVEEDFADLLDFLLSLLTTKDGDFVTVAGDVPARTRWRVARMTSRWKGEIERLQAESQSVIDNCLMRARKKTGYAREAELQMASKHVQYIKLLETGYREVRRLINTVWPLHGMTLVKRLRGEGRVKTASAIGKRGGAVINEMLAKYMGVEVPSLSDVAKAGELSAPKDITPTPTPETRKDRKFQERERDEMDEEPVFDEIEQEDGAPIVDAEVVDEESEAEADVEELSDEEIEEALDLGDVD